MQVPDQFDAFFNPKTASEKNAKIITPPSIGQIENARVLAPPMLFGIELWRQWQPLIFPPIQASDGALRSVKDERRDAVFGLRAAE